VSPAGKSAWTQSQLTEAGPGAAHGWRTASSQPPGPRRNTVPIHLASEELQQGSVRWSLAVHGSAVGH
jgi:hypothetical protein